MQAEKAQAGAKDGQPRAEGFHRCWRVVLVIAAVVGGIFTWDINVPVINPA